MTDPTKATTGRFKFIPCALLLGLALCLTVALKWAGSPARADHTLSDPGVHFMNSAEKRSSTLREGYFEHEGRTLHYIIAGEGPTVLFMHGFPSYWFSFTRQIDALRGSFRVIAIDGLGAGKSDAPMDVEAYELESMAQHLNALLDHLGVEKLHAVGHDWGSAFAFGFAQRHPERVLSVTGIATPPQNVLLGALEMSPKLAETASYIETLKSANPLLIVATGGDKRVWTGAYRPLVEQGLLSLEEGILFRQATGDPKRINAHINWYRANIPAPDAITDSDFWPSRDARLIMPAQIIWGEDDRVFPAELAEAMQRNADDLRLMPIANVGHWPQIERPDAVNKAIVDLISKTRLDE